MEFLIEVQDNKSDFIMELLSNFKFVEAKPITSEKAVLMAEIRESIENLKLVKEGKLKARPAKELLDEL